MSRQIKSAKAKAARDSAQVGWVFGLRVQGLGSRVQGLGFRIQNSGLGFKV